VKLGKKVNKLKVKEAGKIVKKKTNELRLDMQNISLLNLF
jgi:hypothetical protein